MRLIKQLHGRRWQRGDTIVEVLIAILVVSTILGGAYVTTNHSLLDTRDAQERSDGVKLAETQVEQLRTLATTGVLFGGSLPASFCIASGAAVVSTNAACTVNSANVPTSASSGQLVYNLAITKTTVTSGGLPYTTFTASVQWNSLVNTAKDVVQVSYRLNQ